MMRSLWSGVSGLQAHQIAMDVEGNNIANVNTNGFKYGRTNFSDILSQSLGSSTRPNGDTGGTNATQVGLGAGVSSVTNIFSQGSRQTTDRVTDLSLDGDGFFVLSNSGGESKSYSRDGAFGFDASGNLVNSGGYVVQGWNRDKVTGLIDTSTLSQNILVDPGYTAPARATDIINLKANLNAGNVVDSKLGTYALDSTAGLSAVAGAEEHADDIAILANSTGEAISLRSGQGMSFAADGATAHDFIYNTNNTGWFTDATGAVASTSGAAGSVYLFNNTEDLRAGMQDLIDNTSVGAVVTVNPNGQFSVDNSAGASALNLTVVGISGNDNVKFTDVMNNLASIIPAGTVSKEVSGEMYAPTHTTSIDLYDSLGIQHSVKIDFRKASLDTTNGGLGWTYEISVPSPGQLILAGGALTAATGNSVRVEDGIQFSAEGAIASSIPLFAFYPNNGAENNQNFQINMGRLGDYDGVTSYSAKPSTTTAISQNGYSGGDLQSLEVDGSGTVIGTFTNGKTISMAQVAVAKFVNQEGLTKAGGNIWQQSQNSGEPAIGIASSGGRAGIVSSSLETSNVDLSRSLTQLIVIQRGYQANSKTITTSDTMLDTLLSLKR